MQNLISLNNAIASYRTVFIVYFILLSYSELLFSNESVALDDTRSVSVMLPEGWQLIKMMSPPELPAKTINLVNGDYKILITFIGSKDGAPFKMNDDKMVALINKTSMQYVSGSVEGKITIHKIQGDSMRGVYSSFTDKKWVGKQPPPGEFKQVTSCVITVGKSILATVTYLSNDLEGEVFNEGLTILKNLRPQG
ncbi:hypothetical protein [Zooshikella sp. RANM57]|uniref:hypothetical protein n=1 Tax=Zooshikella sp. RANM57 TaxID=3425863 RepID=UPI003D6E8D63